MLAADARARQRGQEQPRPQPSKQRVNTQPASTQADLAPGWQECFDTTHQRPYYHNAATGQSQWDYPSVAASSATRPPPRACGACTFVNLPTADRCEMCDTALPAPAATAPSPSRVAAGVGQAASGARHVYIDNSNIFIGVAMKHVCTYVYPEPECVYAHAHGHLCEHCVCMYARTYLRDAAACV